MIVIYSRAVYKDSKLFTDCRDTTTLWFTTKYPCSVLNFNCYNRGVASPEGNELDALDNGTLSFLSCSHCPAIRVHPSIQDYPNLMGFQLYNCSIQSWSIESAISASKHQQLIGSC